jgi:hypothetical protein
MRPVRDCRQLTAVRGRRVPRQGSGSGAFLASILYLVGMLASVAFESSQRCGHPYEAHPAQDHSRVLELYYKESQKP